MMNQSLKDFQDMQKAVQEQRERAIHAQMNHT